MIKHTLTACAAALLLVGCATTTYTDRDAQGRPQTESGIVHGSSVDGLNRGVNTNYFGPVDSGPNAAWGVGTPSGTFDHRR